MATLVGKVGIVLKGAYNSASTYEIMDAVLYNNGQYIAKQAVPANTPPTNTTYWQTALDANALIPNGYNHNGIYRGNNLGAFSTLAAFEAFLTEHEVSSGKFTDLYLGDYFTIQDGTYNAAWVIAGFGTECNRGSSAIPNKNTLSLIPRTTLGNASMNSTNTTGVSKNTDNPLYATTGGTETAKYQAYWGSDMAQITMPAVEAALNGILGSHLKSRDILCSDTINASVASMAGAGLTGAATGWGWHSVKAALMTEVQVYGSMIESSSYYDVGEGDQQLPLFKFVNHVAYMRASFWLRGVASSTYFADANSAGYATAYDASYAYGVRPLIVVG